MEFYAHSTDSPDKEDWQPLEEHLRGVAELAEKFSAAFGAGDWGRLAGLLHDAGKATSRFIERLEGSSRRVDHSTFGARLAAEETGPFGKLLAYAIAGHHGGLPDGGTQESELHYRLKLSKVPDDVVLLPEIELGNKLRPPFRADRQHAGFSLAFFTRMLFSCLVDADFLDTERFCSPEKSGARPDSIASLTDLRDKLDAHLTDLAVHAEPTAVNRLRQEILAQCRSKARLKPQIFSLTVPTGGGKTLSSLAFALDHAVANGQSRVIYAIPFTSIIEQNAKVFQDILGREQVLEHHCNYKESDQPEEAGYNRRRGLATENWDAPLVVTTNVQFFESLFSNKPSRCRKLHNIAGSVIVLDEAQTIPTEYLESCLAALRELVEHYRCTVVLCTATQPALDDSTLRNRLPAICEIIDQPQRLYRDLCRTRVEFVGQLSNEALVEKLATEDQVLCIVSTKPQARALFERLPETEGNYHLSTNMYPQHRRRVLNKIRLRLKQEKSCRVVSTSLVEAGVDLDFPVVYRAMAGLDSIAQAAGRCNREGKLNEIGQLGQVYVYEPEQPPRMPWVKRCASRAAEALRSLPEADPIGLEMMRRYFALLYDVQELDKKKIYPLLNQLTPELYFPFRETAEAFRFIEDETVGVIIPGEAEAEMLVQQLRYTEFPRAVLRKLQTYTVAVRSREFAVLNSAGALEMVAEQFPVLRNLSAYQDSVGLCIDESEVWNPEELIS
ncbi:CRISPR-associated helicase/endonuclease Cas3 [Geothermobacter hydrogeniphilus]|uniref:CRISPR-associated helicase/endonuclease Cas3 n=2 Tax=Geothermobacter hydrogeniphilus TaxID=1969733 RepID=A0A2K2HCR4_9BACT|nr:CRISPR-associated helicase/endonuclease Cas3 [Geothermobacter hydrogeniphilus]